MPSWEVSIGLFEGPMDLLVYLVQREELDPRRISISAIADQFLAHIEGIEQTDLAMAGDFLEMAAKLLSLKARELLPREQQTEEELIEFSQQREEILRSFVEYQQFKKMAGEMQSIEDTERQGFGRGRPERLGAEDEGQLGSDEGVFQLYEAFRRTMRSRSWDGERVHTIEIDFYTIQDAQQNVENFLRRHGRAAFEELVGADRQPLVVTTTFQALLEMVKTEQIILRQTNPSSQLWIYRKKDNPQFFDEMEQDHSDFTPDPSFAPGLVELVRRRSRGEEEDSDLDAMLRELMRRIEGGGHVGDRDIDRLIADRAIARGDLPMVAADSLWMMRLM
jgi:chromatin segregation and condensation protein Rec8/ScpA/Scc1 (kleisin family)